METTQVSPEGGIDKQNVVHPYKGNYSASKRKGTLTQATTWLNLEDVMLSEMSPIRKDKYYAIPLM